MGDEYSRLCPECGDRLNVDAKQCVCGWGKQKRGTIKQDTIVWDHVCQWHYGDLRCKYPVGQFAQGMHTGFCLFHRATPSGHQAAQIANDSQQATREQYLDAAKRTIYGHGDNPTVARLRAGLRKTGAPSHSPLSRYLPREPGQDEAEFT